jgi:hypothetical protein
LNDFSPMELLSGRKPDISHFRTFGCQVWVPTAEPKRTTISKHREGGVYLGFDSPSIIRYLILATGVMHKARFQNCTFDENSFPATSSENNKPSLSLDFWAPEIFTMNLDPRTSLADSEVKKLLDLKQLAEKLPDGFTNIPRITRNPLPGAGSVPISIRPETPVSEKPRQPVKKARLSHHSEYTNQVETLESEVFTCTIAENEEIMAFVQEIAISENDPLTLEQAKASTDWPKWHTAMQAEYDSLRKHQVFGPLVHGLKTKPVGHKLIFVKKRNANGDVARYKVRLVAQGFTQRPGIDFQFTYSPVMDSGTFRYILGMAAQYSLETQLLDVVTAYLYGPLDAHIYIKPPPEFLTTSLPNDHLGVYSGLRIQKALYGLKQAGRMWYKHLHDFLIHHKFSHDQALPCLFTLKHHSGFVIIAVYVDDLNLVGTPETCQYAVKLLTNQFEMKVLGKTTFCLGLQLSHLLGGGIFLHQTTYTQKLLRRFGMDKSNPLAAPMIGRNKTSDDPYTPCDEEEEEYPDRTNTLQLWGHCYTYPHIPDPTSHLR